MPELPEVETIRTALAQCVVGQEITQVEVFSPAMRTSLLPLKTAELAGKTITAVRRRGRYLLVDLSDNRVLVMHFGMSGVLRLEPASVPKRKHEHLFFHLSSGEIMRFECTRRFSSCEVWPLKKGTQVPENLADLGPEPLSNEFSGKYLYEKSRKKKGCVKNFIMDNLVVVGVGNIYAAESLFAAKVSPLRPAGELTLAEAESLVTAIKAVLKQAIAAGGTTIHDYRHVDGSEGKFVQQLKMYGRENEPCIICGTPIAQVRLGGRSSCYCPKCQK